MDILSIIRGLVTADTICRALKQFVSAANYEQTATKGTAITLFLPLLSE